MNHCLQETNTHWQTTWPNVLQSYFTQSDYGTNLDEKSKSVSDSDDSLADKIKHLNTFLIKNNYSTDFIERNTHIGPNDSSNNSYTTTAHYTLHDTRDFRNYTTHTTTLQHPSCTQTHVHLTVPTNVKGKDEPEDRSRKVYKIKCSDCQATCIGKNLTSRLKEHKRATKKGGLNNSIAEHHL